jgi:methylated-DNA-[protein]-cysteine S-methyltransferase
MAINGNQRESSMISYSEIESPVGRLILRTNGLALTGIYFDGPNPPPRELEHWTRNTKAGPLVEAARQLEEYFSGARREFELPLEMEGTEFQKRAWRNLLTIPYGETRSYGDQAKLIGNANASRAVGLANGRNPIPIVVPCHRVIGANGSLTGFGGGLERKRWLLAHEGYFHLSGRTTVNTAPAARESLPGHMLRS